MKVQYLEIVTRDVDAVITAYASALNVQFSEPDAGLGGARTASLAGGGLVGVRVPLRDTEDPVVRPYWLVPDIDAALDAVVHAGGEIRLWRSPGMVRSPSIIKAAMITVSGSCSGFRPREQLSYLPRFDGLPGQTHRDLGTMARR